MTASDNLGARTSASGACPTGTPVGRRRITAASLSAQVSGIPFRGLPDGVTAPAKLKAVVLDALAIMGVSDKAITLAGRLADRVQKSDWKTGSRPMCWPSNRVLQDELMIGERHLRRCFADLIDAGALIMADSANMKRYGTRDNAGRVVPGQTFGFDLSTWSTNFSDFQAIVAEHRADCARRHDAHTTAKREKRKVDDLAKLDPSHVALADLSRRADALWAELIIAQSRPDRLATRSGKTEILASIAYRMEQIRLEAVSVAAPHSNSGQAVDLTGKEDNAMSGRPDSSVRLKNNTKTYQNQNFVQAQPENVVGCSSNTQLPTDSTRSEMDTTRWVGGLLKMREVKTTPSELTALIPELKRRLNNAEPNWGTVSKALDAFADEYGIGKPLRRQAERLMGWQSYYIGLAIVASKKEGYFDLSHGAYFNGGILQKAKRGELDLRASLFRLREDTPSAHHLRPRIPHGKLVDRSAITQTDVGEIRLERDKIAVQRPGPKMQTLGSALTLAQKVIAPNTKNLMPFEIPRDLKRTINDAVIGARQQQQLAEASTIQQAADDDSVSQKIKAEHDAMAASYEQARQRAEPMRQRLSGLVKGSPEWRREVSYIRSDLKSAGVNPVYFPIWLR
jgi:hypothetical protein